MPTDTFTFQIEISGRRAIQQANSFIAEVQKIFQAATIPSPVTQTSINRMFTGTSAIAGMAEEMRALNKEMTSSSRRIPTWTARWQSVGDTVKGVTTLIKEEYRSLTREEKKLFKQIIFEANAAADTIVGSSIIPDMVLAIIRQFEKLRKGEEGVFQPLVQEAAEASKLVQQKWQTAGMVPRTDRGPLAFPKGAVSPSGQKIGGRRASLQQYNEWLLWQGRSPIPSSQAQWPKNIQPDYINQLLEGYQRGAIGDFRGNLTASQQNFMNGLQAAMSGASLRMAPDDASRVVTGLERTMKDFSTATARMNMSPLQYVGAGRMERIGSAMQAAQAQNWGIRSFGYEVQRQGRSLMMGGGAILGGAGAAAQKYLEYADPLGRSARNLELNAEMTELLNDRLREQAGIVTTLSAQDQAEGLYQWAAATGATVTSVEDLNRILDTNLAIQKLAILNNKDLQETTEVVTDVQSQFKINIGETDRVVAVLNRTAAVSKADLSDLGEAFRYAGARAEQSGMSFEETATLFEVLAASGQRGGQAGRGVMRLLDNLIAPSKEAAEILEELVGPNGLTDQATGQFIGLDATVAKLARSFENMTEMEQQEVIARMTSQNAAKELIPLIQLELEARKRGFHFLEAATSDFASLEHQKYATMVEEIYGYSVSTEDALSMMDRYWTQYMESDAGRAQQIKTNWDSALLAIGKSVTETLLPELTKMTEWATGIIDSLEEHPFLVEQVVKAGGLMLALGALITVLGKPITLYADVKMVTAALGMKTAADTMMAAALLEQKNALIKAGSSAVSPGVAGAVGGAGAAAWIKGLSAPQLAGIAAVVLATVGEGNRQKQEHDFYEVLSALNFQEGEIQLLKGNSPYYYGGKMRGYTPDYNLPTFFQNGTLYAVTEEGRKEVDLQEAVVLLWEKKLIDVDRYRELMAAVTPETKDEALIRVGYADAYAMEMKARSMGYQGPGVQAQPFSVEDANALLNRSIAVVDLVRHLPMELSTALSLLINFSEVMKSLSPDLANLLAGFGTMIDQFDKMTSYVVSIGSAASQYVTGKVDLTKLQSGYGSDVQEVYGRLEALAGRRPEEELMALGANYVLQMAQAYMVARNMGELEAMLYLEQERQRAEEAILIVEDEEAEKDRLRKESLDNAAKAHEDYLKDMERAEEAFRGKVAQILGSPTPVTAQQMAESATGAYKPQWDEAARRVRAAMQGSPDWDWLIPANVKEGGDDSVQAWGEQWLSDFYNGMMPDQVDWDAFAGQFQGEMDAFFAKEAFVDRAIEELKKRGIDVSDEKVREFLGMKTPMATMITGGLSASTIGSALSDTAGDVLKGITIPEEDYKAAGTTVATGLGGVISTQMQEVDWTDKLKTAISLNLQENPTALLPVGRALGQPVVDGILDVIKTTDFVGQIVGIVTENIKAWLGSR